MGMVRKRFSALWCTSAALAALGVAFAFLPVDWIERRLGWSLDGGDGAVELLLVLVPIVLAAAFAVLARRASQRRSRHAAVPHV